MTCKSLFLGLVILYCFVQCNSCRSWQQRTTAEATTTTTMTTPSSSAPIAYEKLSLQNLFIEGNINGKTSQDAGSIPKEIFFSLSDRIEYSCYHNYTEYNDMEIYWYQKKGKTAMFYGERSKKSIAHIQMKLYKFDNDSVLFCCVYSSKFNNSIEIRLHLQNRNTSVVPYVVRNVNILEGTNFTKTCDENDSTQAVTGNNSVIITKPLYKFKIEQHHDGMLLYCVGRNVIEKDTSTKTERKITRIDKLLLRNFEKHYFNSTENYDDNKKDFNLYRILMISAGVICLTVFTTILLYICKKRKQINSNSRRNVDLQSEPIYSDPQQIIYAQLQMAEGAPSRSGNFDRTGRCEEPSPYAEIVGVLEPKG